MTAINNIDKAETTSNAETILGGQVDGNTLQAKEAQAGAEGRQSSKVKAESELRAAARRHGLTLKELASLMGVNYGHLCSVANGRRPWTPNLREKVMAVLGEVPGQGVVYRQGGVITGESSFIRERAREIGLSMKELAHRVGVSAAYMTQAARGQRNMSPAVQARVEAVLGVPAKIEPAQCVYPQGGAFSGESSYIREQARAMGMNLKGLADRVGVSSAYMTQVSRGQKHMSPAVQAKVEAELGAPVRIEAAERPTVEPRALWDRMEAHGFSQNETARRAGISSALLSQIMNGQRTPSGRVLEKLHGVLFQPSAAELVVPAEVKVLAWKKGGRNGVVVRGAGGPGAGGQNPGGGTVRIGGRVPWGAEVEYAYRAGYDSRGRVSVAHLVDERGYHAMLNRPEPGVA